MEEWSKFQPEEFLEATRQSFLADEFAPVIANRCGIRNGAAVLEMGCGTGAFSRYLSQTVEEVSFTGVDLDETFLQYMGDRPRSGTNTFLPVRADGISLCFPDETFDAVCSHTFLSCVPQPEKVMKEMLRVCKTGGIVSSVTAMSWKHECNCDGNYPEEVRDLMRRYQTLYLLMYRAYQSQFGGMSMAQGISLHRIPGFFSDMGLKEISILPIGRAFSLSDAGIPVNEKRRYVLNYYEGERKRLEHFRSYFWADAFISKENMKEFSALLIRWKEFWLAHLEDNGIWEWNGGSQLLVCGRK